MKRFLFVLTLALLFDPENSYSQQPQGTEKIIDTLSCKINNEILQTTLKLADEMFINGNDSAAIKYYKQAMERVNYYALNLNCVDNNYYRLCRNNIEYRLMLLDNGMDFWGISYNMTPLNPVTHHDKFKELKQLFDEKVKEINEMIGKVGTAEDKVSEEEAYIELAKTESSVQLYEQNKQEIRINQYDENINLARNKIEVMNARQIEIEKEAIAKSEQANELTGSMTGMVVSALCQAAGLPVDPTKLKLDQSLKDNLINTGIQLAANDPSIRESIKDISNAADKLITIYHTVDSLKDKIQSIRQSAKEVYEFVHKPTFDKMIAIGEKLVGQISPEQLKQWKDASEKYKNLSSLVHLADQFPDLKRVLINRLLKETNVTEKLFQVFESEKKEFTLWLLKATGQAIELINDASSKNILVENILHNAADKMVEQMSNAVLEEWKKVSGKTSIPELVQWLKQVKLSDISVKVHIEGVSIVFNETGIKADLREAVKKLEDIAGKDQLILYSGSAISFCKQVLSQNLPDLKKIFMQQIGQAVLNEAGNAIFNGLQAEQIHSLSNSMYDEVMTSLKTVSANTNQVEDKVTAFNTGSFFVTNQNGQEPASMQMPAQGSSMSASDMYKQAILTAGIAAACPYVAIAGKFIGAWHQRSQLLDRLETIYKEQKEITVKKLYTYDLLHELILNRSIANLDKRISEERQLYNRYLFDLYKGKAAASSKNAGIYRLRVNNRKALLFFLSEKLREQYALINKAMLHRHGYSLYEKILNNPDNLRYAIDEDISLFQWLDNSVQSTRSDIDKLKVYWDAVDALIITNCDECRKEYAPLVDALETDPVSIKRTFPAEWQHFTEAVNEGKSSYDFTLQILPGRTGIVQDHDKKLKMRILDVRLGGLGQNNSFVRLTNAKLFHTGVSYLFDGEYYKKEVFQPQVKTGIEPGDVPLNNDLAYWPQPFRINDLKQRWQQQGGRPNLPLEGYGFYSIYRLRVNITSETRSLTDISLRFAYSYQPTEEDMLPDSRRIVFKNASTKMLKFRNDDLKGLSGKRNDWIFKVNQLLNDKNIVLPNEFFKLYDIIQVDKEIKSDL